MLIHLDDFVGMHNGQVQPLDIVLSEFRVDHILAAHQVDAYAIFARGLHRPQHGFSGSFISPHDIEGNTNGSTHASLSLPIV